jgi:hypothetical protein
MTKVLIISDTQAPGHHPNTIEFLKKVNSQFKPDRIVHIGDELDLHNLSKYKHDPDLPGPAEEIEQGLEFMEKLYKLFPEVDVCISNHGSRPYLRAYEAGIPKNFIRSYREWMRAPKGWNWGHKFIIDNVGYIHGEGLSGDGARLKACTLLQRSTVFGHLHSHAGVSWFSSKENLMFGFNVGCLIDPHSAYFEYNRHQLYRPIIGCGLVQDQLPIFIPMVLDKYCLWVDRKNKTTRPILDNNGQPECPKCGSTSVQRRGTRGRATQKIYCLKCTKWSTI